MKKTVAIKASIYEYDESYLGVKAGYLPLICPRFAPLFGGFCVRVTPYGTRENTLKSHEASKKCTIPL
jgi:hypothetical protein